MSNVKISTDDRALKRKLQQLEHGLIDTTGLMKILGEIALTSISDNFERGGRPPWLPLSPATVALKGHARILIQAGILKKVFAEGGNGFVRIRTQPAAKDYAAIQQFGGQAGRNRKVKIPARPYLVLQLEDLMEMEEETRLYLQKSAE